MVLSFVIATLFTIGCVETKKENEEVVETSPNEISNVQDTSSVDTLIKVSFEAIIFDSARNTTDTFEVTFEKGARAIEFEAAEGFVLKTLIDANNHLRLALISSDNNDYIYFEDLNNLKIASDGAGSQTLGNTIYGMAPGTYTIQLYDKDGSVTGGRKRGKITLVIR
jgi:hypothetical protein